MSLLSLSKRILNRDGASKQDAKKEAAKKPKKAKKSDEAESVASVVAGEIGLFPVVTEKSLRQHEKNTVTFRVHASVTKNQIIRAVEDALDTKVLSVRTARMNPKNRRRGLSVGRTNNWKKAYVLVEDIKSLTGGV